MAGGGLRSVIGQKTVACLGGTFNRLHAGHRLLFKTAFEVADLVRVGVTSDALVRAMRGPKASHVRPYVQRAAHVERLLRPFGQERFAVVALEDPLAPVGRPEFDAIVVSPDTHKTALVINERRQAAGLPALKVVVVPLLLAHDGKPISSTRVLEGLIDEEGKAVTRAPAGRRPKPAARRKAIGTKASAKRARGRSSARTGSRASGPRSRRRVPPS
jgi:pantetheine-phosphate adenylyltransferase